MADGTDGRARVRRRGDCVHPFEPDEPSGYIGWHAWARRKARTHVQQQCPDCGLYASWIPKEQARELEARLNGLVARGWAEKGPDGRYRLTEEGRRVLEDARDSDS